jgi:branched-chain amino acid transport system ATP-binding protein
MSSSLQVSGLRLQYGVIEAVKGIDLYLERGKITALLGANGAGKSTTLLALSGLIHAAAGSVILDGVELQNLSSHQIVAKGLVQVPEGREILTALTVRENLLLGAYRRQQRSDVNSDLERLLELFPRLRERVEGRGGEPFRRRAANARHRARADG